MSTRELIVVGDVAGLDPTGWGMPSSVVACPETHPNRRRTLGLEVAAAPVIAFIDDDALPEPGWLAAASRLPVAAREIWTGPESPVRTSRGARLAYAVSSSVLAEGTRAHVDRRDRVIRWSDVPFCNLVTTSTLLDEIGPPSSDVPWDMDDFELCRRAHRRGVTFRNVAELAIRHDRYPDRLGDWLADKAADRRRTGEKLVTHPHLYSRVPGVVAAAVVPWLVAATLGLTARSATRLGPPSEPGVPPMPRRSQWPAADMRRATATGSRERRASPACWWPSTLSRCGRFRPGMVRGMLGMTPWTDTSLPGGPTRSVVPSGDAESRPIGIAATDRRRLRRPGDGSGVGTALLINPSFFRTYGSNEGGIAFPVYPVLGLASIAGEILQPRS